MKDVERCMQEVSRLRRRLVILDGGMVGAACPGTRAGDQVCFVAGCTSAAVLRKRRHSGETQYQVVGKASVHLSREDKDKYRAFYLSSQFYPTRSSGKFLDTDKCGAWFRDKYWQEYQDLIKKYQQEPW